MKNLYILTTSLLFAVSVHAQKDSTVNHKFQLAIGLGQSFSIGGLKAQVVFDKKIDYAFYASVSSLPPLFPVGGSIGGKVYFYKYAFVGAQVGTASMVAYEQLMPDNTWKWISQNYLYGPSAYIGIDKPIGRNFLLNLALGQAYVVSEQWNTPHIDIGFSYQFLK